MTDHERVLPYGTPVESVQDADIANVFLTALAMRNFQRLETCFHPDMRFRALVPPAYARVLVPRKQLAGSRRGSAMPTTSRLYSQR